MADVSKLEFGSEAWKTHMRRSLAQRKRHGEKITNIEDTIKYIEKKGPLKQQKVSSPQPKTLNKNSTTPNKTVAKNKSSQTVTADGLFRSPTILKVK